jgi:hypothetical protein
MRKILLLALVVLFFHDNFTQNNGRIHLYIPGRGDIVYHMTRALTVNVPPELEVAFGNASSYWQRHAGVALFLPGEEDADIIVVIDRTGQHVGLASMDGKLDLRNKVYNITGGRIKISPSIIRNPVCEDFVMIHELGHMLGLGDDVRTGRIMDGRGLCHITPPLDSDRELVLEDIRNAGILDKN